MKKYTLMAAMTASMLVWNCKSDEVSVENEVKPKLSGARAAATAVQWDLTLGGAGQEELTAGIVLADKGMLLTGWTNSNIPNSVTAGINVTNGKANFLIADVSANGIVRHQLIWGGSGNDIVQSVVPASFAGIGGYLIGGYSDSPKAKPYKEDGFWSPFDGTPTNDYWIVRFTADHKKLYDKVYGSGGDDRLKKIVPTSDGGFLLAGTSDTGPMVDPVTKKPVGNRTAPNLGTQDYWIVKIDAIGNILWDKVYGGGQRDILSDAIRTSDGGFLLVGDSYSDGNDGGNRTAPRTVPGCKDFWMVKIDANGNIMWDRAYGTGRNSCTEPYVTEALTGGFLLAGTTSPSSHPTIQNGPSDYYSQYYVVRTDSRGNQTWGKMINSNKASSVCSVVTTANGEFIISGTSSAGSGFNKSEPLRGAVDYWLVKLDKNGMQIEDRTYGGTASDYNPKALILSPVSLVVAGSSTSSVGEDKQTPGKGGSDIWALRINL